jgi:diguanylate cyclase (GGDEF)-like protein/PAS domain S-box-containing protein
VPRKKKDIKKEEYLLSKEADLHRQIAALKQAKAEIKQLKEDLRLSEGRFRAVFGASPDGIYFKDRNLRFTAVNSAFVKQFGIPAKKLLGTTGRAFIKKEARVALQEEEARVLGGEIIQREKASYLKGTSSINRVTKVPVRDEDGEIVGLCCISHDITERTRTEELLRQERESLYAILDRAPYGVMVQDHDGKTLYVNSEFTTITGYLLADIPTLQDWDRLAFAKKKQKKAARTSWRRDVAQRAMDDVFRQKLGRLFARTYGIVTKGGAIKDIEFKPTVLADGRILLMLSDITERKRIEQELRKNRENYQSVIDNINRGITLIDSDHNIITANAPVGAKLNKPVSEVIGKKCFREFEKRDAVCPNCPGVRAMATGQPAEFESEAMRDDGSRFYTRVSAFPVLSDNKKVTGFIEIIEDISDRKTIEEELRQSEERFRRVVETMRVGLSAVDANGIITYVNDQMCQMLGYTTDEMIGHSTVNFFEEESGRRQEEIFEKRRKGFKDSTPYEVTWVAKDGHKVNTILTPTPGFSQRGKFSGSFAIFTDITERKRIEEALHESKERYQTLMNNIDLGINLIDAGHNIVMVNAAQDRHFKKPMLDAIGKKCFREFEKRNTVCPHCPGVKTMTTGKPNEVEREAVRDDGSCFQVRLRTFPIFDEAGAVTSFIEVAEDITERKRMEEALRQSEERSRRLVETMRAGLSAADENGVLTYVNDQLCQMLGYKMGELLGRPVTQFLTEESRKFQEETFIKRKKKFPDTTPYEITWLTKDRQKVYTITSPTPRFGADGRFIGSFAISTDITKRREMEEALRESEERFRMLADNAPFGISIMSPDRRFEYFNPKFTDIFGYTKKDIPDKESWFSKAYPDEAYRNMVADLWKRDREEGITLGELTPRIFTVRCKKGQDKIIDFRTVNLKGGGQYLTYEDITERARAEKALRDNEEKYRSLVQFTEDPVYLVNKDQHYLFMNEKYLSRIGMPLNHVVGRHYAEFHSSEESKEFSEHVAQVCRTGRFVQYEHRSRRDGRYFLRTLSPVRDTDGQIETITVISKDITERKRVEKELTYMATHDSLTGLPNRMLFNDRLLFSLAQAQRRHKKIALMLLDLDNFKDVNDTLGHSVGDQLLRAVGNRLRRLLRKEDTVARVGGDEFLLLLPEIARAENAITIAKKILAAFRKPCIFDDYEIPISTSIGIAIYPDDSDDADTLLKHADIAMYAAKDRGRGIYQCYAQTISAKH